MERILILNGSPRAPRSNSKRYAALFSARCPLPSEYCEITKTNHAALCAKVDAFSQILFVFPLYADSLPVTLLGFLKQLEQTPPVSRPRVSVLINCGFLEPEQNDVAIRMLELFCKQNRYPFGAVLKIASGEAILDSPFLPLVKRKIRLFAKAVAQNRRQIFQVTMPLTKGSFLRASTRYWIRYGKKNNVTEAQMRTMQIENS